MSKNTDYQSLSNELDKVLTTLQDDSIGIDEAVKAYTRGMEIIQQLEGQLKDAENKVTKIKADWDASLAA